MRALTPKPQPRYDVIIVGGGMTGLSTAYHLSLQGIKNLALVNEAQAPAASWLTPGLLSGGLSDNFTRFSHAHGPAFARELWKFGDDCFDTLLAFLGTAKLPHLCYGRLRLLTSAAEKTEGEQAVAQLQQAGFPSRLLDLAKGKARRAQANLALGQRVLALQDDGPRGGWVDPQALGASLRAQLPASLAVYTDPALHLESSAAGVQLHLGGAGQKLEGEALVLACHLGIGRLLPVLAPALVPIADQWFARPAVAGFQGLAFSANHGYEWGVGTPERLFFGGARYLRPLAGVGQERAVPEARVSKHLQALLPELLALDAAARAPSPSSPLQGAGVDIRPCDELPLIGPMYGDERLLLATGYMGQGLTLGFAAGKHLAELLAKGHTAGLPRFLWPERLRSLSI